uniref:Uncharacterized protein n=1 Tax=Myoviridae sp. ct3Pt8 TaxID=2826608 RepID=A0A8S5MMV6_9CAUD|nr:MAG TPA: hypothetical protein [Myoviridae sp. ct3Pt8]
MPSIRAGRHQRNNPITHRALFTTGSYLCVISLRPKT